MNKTFKIFLSLILVLVIFCSCIPFTASADIGDNEFTEQESNNTMGLSNRIYNDYTVYGYCGSSDLDYFKFTLSTYSTVQITAVGDNAHLYVGIVDSTDEVVAAGKTSYQSSSGAYGTYITKSLSAGTYYVLILNEETYYTNNYAFYFKTTSSGSSHTHSYSAYKTNPTCTEQGYTTYSCSCGDSYVSDYVPEKGHFSDTWIVETVASCEQDGYRYKICDTCNTVFDSETIAKQHTTSDWIVYEKPTSTRTGTLAKICVDCGAVAESFSITCGLNKGNNIIVFITPQGQLAYDSWEYINGAWYYFDEKGFAVTETLLTTSAGTCYFNASGVMLSNAWKLLDGKWYFFGANGYMVKNAWRKDTTGWVYLGADGAMKTNAWVRDSVGWCYVGADGYAVTNCWKKDSYGWCYLNANGSMTKNKWIKDGGKWYYLNASGYMVTNKWMKDSKGWVYLGSSGAMLTNAWCQDSQGWCFVGADGYAVTNCWKKDSIGWIWLNSSGSMTKNKWIKDAGKWYYLDSDGYMATDTWERDGSGWHYINASGYMTSHSLDWHSHSFSAPTYTARGKCSCGAERGKILDFPIYLSGSAPFYTNYRYGGELKVDNLYYRLSSSGTYVTIYFDVTAIDAEDYEDYYGAKFKLYDEKGYLIDDAQFFQEMYLGETVRSEYVTLSLTYWDEYSDLYLVIENVS